MSISNTQKTIHLGLMVGLAMGLHVFESFLPLPYLFPGAKLGLANIVTLYVIVSFGIKEAVLISVLRTVLGSLLIGTLLNITFFLGFFGGLASALVMGILHHLFRDHVSLVGISIIGALTHNITQVGVAAYFLGTLGFFFYLPYLLIFSLPTGLFVGVATAGLLRKNMLKPH